MNRLNASDKEIEQRLEAAFSTLYPAIAEASEKRASTRRKNWDSKHNITQFTPGTIVLVKRQGIIGKLEPRYVGPYEVAKKTTGGSYLLVDGNNNLLPKGFPPSHLKTIESKPLTKAFLIDRIMNHKDTGKQRLYQVRWLGYGPEDDTWEPVENFIDRSVVQEYELRNST